MTGAAWFVAFTEARREARAIQALAELGYAAWTPQETAWAERPRRARGAARPTQRRPLFPRYVFVRQGPGQGLHRIRAADAVMTLIGAAGRPLPVDPWRLAALWSAEQAGAFDLTRRGGARRGRGFAPGQSVRVTAGPFRGFVAEVMALRGTERVRLLFRAIGTFGPGPAEVDVGRVEAT